MLSSDLTASVALLVGCLLLLWTGGTLAARIMGGFREWCRDVPASEWTQWHVTTGARWMSMELIGLCGVVVAGLMVTGLAFGFAQVGFVISFKPLVMNWSRVLPENGWAKILSLESGVRGLLSALKVAILLSVTALLVWMKRRDLSSRNFESVEGVAAFAWQLGLAVCIAMAGASVGLAMIDYLVKWFQNEQKLKMTRTELKQEQKDDQGDPQIRAAIRRKQREVRKRQSVKDVPKATIILTNPTHLAVAIQYEAGKMRAPKIVAKGAGVFAANIVRIARENKIPVLERKPLARALFKNAEVGQEIPFEFFRAIAEILAQIYKARQMAA